MSGKAAQASFESTEAHASNEMGSLKELSGLSEDLAILEKTVWRKLDRWILPVATLFYLLAFFDRTNIANARVAGMQESLRMTDKQYSIALTVTYMPYIAAELPSNLLLRIVGPDLMLPAMVTLWGLVTTLQGLIQNYHGLLACRFFLGLFEGGLFPGLVLYLSYFYPRSKLNVRISTFFASAALAGAFSGLLAAAIINMDRIGGKAGWAWIFILEGIFTFLFGLFSFFIFPRSISTARFLSAREKEYALATLQGAGVASSIPGGDDFSWREVWEAFRQPHMWLFAPAFFFCGTMLYSQAYFEPTVVQGLGFTSVRAQLFSVPPFATSFALSLVVAYVSDKFSCRGLASMFSATLCIIGYSMFLGSEKSSIRYASLFFSVSGAYINVPTISTWLANNTAPHVRRATAIALAHILSNSGGILVTWLLGTLSPAPAYHKATVTFVAMSTSVLALAIVILFYFVGQNKRKTGLRRSLKREIEPNSLGNRSAWYEYSL